MLITKTKEWILAIRLERNYTKREILRMYLNTVEFGSNAFGINTAAKTFFNKKPKNLTLRGIRHAGGHRQCALGRFNPVRNPERSKQPAQLGTAPDGQSPTTSPTYWYKDVPKLIVLHYNVENPSKGMAPYFRAEVGKSLLGLGPRNRPRPVRRRTENLYHHRLAHAAVRRVGRGRAYGAAAKAGSITTGRASCPGATKTASLIPNFLKRPCSRTQRYKSLMTRFEGNRTP